MLLSALQIEEDGGEGFRLPPARPARRRTLHVLLAEDHPINRQVAVRLLERQGHHVTTVSDGREAVEALHGQSFDVVLMDVQMPGMGGFEATAMIRQAEQQRPSDRHLPIIAMTAHALAGDRQRCLEAGMDGYLSKPISAAALGEEIARLVPDAAVAEDTVEPAGADDALDRRVLDLEAALARIDNDRSLLAELMRLFLEEYPGQRAALRGAVKQGDFQALGRLSHALRGAVSNFFAHDAMQAAEALEQAAAAEDAAAAKAALKRLEREVDRLKPHLILQDSEPSP